MADWVTQREAAALLGVHLSAVPKMIRRGDLMPRPDRPSLARADVLALRDARADAAAEREERRRTRRKPAPAPPDSDHVWLRTPGAAAVMGVTDVAIGARARRGRLPFTEHDGVRWFALDQLELVKRADRAQRSGRTEETGGRHQRAPLHGSLPEAEYPRDTEGEVPQSAASREQFPYVHRKHS